MKLPPCQSLALLLLLLAVALHTINGRTSNLNGEQVYRQAASRTSRGGRTEVVFSSEEESLLRGQQSDTAHMLAARLPGKTPIDVQKRCVELGLRCGGDVEAPIRNSEKWRKARHE
ncbi:hypothetical protein BBJ28_00006798 [Nothophytophthora sp. Chile5]|nr:hypothetical protein BBJ28_00006798 [Nothophytophthora sp. Chile5]